MSMRIRLSALALPAVAACGGGGSTDIDASLRFADLTDLEISRLVSAATASEGFQAQSQADRFADPFGDNDPCPARSFSGDTGTITGGCTTVDGVTYEGSIEVRNPWDWCIEVDADGFCSVEHEGDFTDDTVFTFHQFASVQSGFRMSWDGMIVLGGNYSDHDMDVTMELMGVAVRSDIYIDYGTSSASISGSGVELIGVGGARVSGHISVSDGGSGEFTLDGADTVEVTLASNCVSWVLVGTGRSFSPCGS